MELQWSRLELGLLCFGFCAGGMQSAGALEELAEVSKSRHRKGECKSEEQRPHGCQVKGRRPSHTVSHEITPARPQSLVTRGCVLWWWLFLLRQRRRVSEF